MIFPKARVAAVVPSVDLNKNTEKRMITHAFLSYDVVHFHDAPYSFCCQFDGRGGDQQRLDHVLLQYVCCILAWAVYTPQQELVIALGTW